MAGSTTTRRALLGGHPVAHVPATDRLARLLGLELLAAFTYDHILNSSVLPADMRQTLAPVPTHERAHAAALDAALRARGAGDRAPRGPADVAAANRDLRRRKVRGRLGQLQGTPDALDTLAALERVIVGAYYVTLLDLDDGSLIALAMQIMASDAQHQAIVAELIDPDDIPDAVPYGLDAGVQ
ncbi:MAG: ferritin-like domain-containing protein [Solirubrobacterales bacterium]|nr:ferritin-like domain-containing protein [Solirubrobacterales bacterium]